MVTRKAIIVASPLNKGQRNHLPGVEADVDNYKRFLTSPSGGYWYPNEIVVLWNPTKLEVLQKVQSAETDYAMTIFSGHGGIDNRLNKDFITLNNSENIWISDLSTRADRQLAIIDACSTFVDSGMSSFIGDPGIAGIPFRSRLSADKARKIFDYMITKSGYGWTVVHSSSPGQASIDTPDGGYFSQSLLQSSSDWAERFEPKAILPIEVAYNRSYRYIKNVLQAEQTPRISHFNGVQCKFPFALRYSHEMHYR